VECVTYILGAGFSAPLGIPIMSDFLTKSRDLYFADPKRYQHFKSVFETIQELSIIKNYFQADLFNIEEILSIIEMGTFLEGKRLRKVFLKYISDVVDHYTPEIKPYPRTLPGNWYDFVFGGDNLVSPYGYFTASLLSVEFGEFTAKDAGIRWHFVQKANSSLTNYNVITLNYDLVLENICRFITDNYRTETQVHLKRAESPDDSDWPTIAKLHGSVDSDLSVPPTWAKTKTPRLTGIWKTAYQLLKASNHIRFIGYSLPVADAYIKYLIKSAAVRAEHLKGIDIICLDPGGAVRARFEDFIEFPYYRFADADVLDYLLLVEKTTRMHHPKPGEKRPFRMDVLEEAHEAFMRDNVKQT
jgi:hypothetical protein